MLTSIKKQRRAGMTIYEIIKAVGADILLPIGAGAHCSRLRGVYNWAHSGRARCWEGLIDEDWWEEG